MESLCDEFLRKHYRPEVVTRLEIATPRGLEQMHSPLTNGAGSNRHHRFINRRSARGSDLLMVTTTFKKEPPLQLK